jgi:hypothetical protein
VQIGTCKRFGVFLYLGYDLAIFNRLDAAVVGAHSACFVMAIQLF